MAKNNHWEIISIAADKRAWLRHHAKMPDTAAKNLFYDETAKRLLSQINLLTNNTPIQMDPANLGELHPDRINHFVLCFSYTTAEG